MPRDILKVLPVFQIICQTSLIQQTLSAVPPPSSSTLLAALAFFLESEKKHLSVLNSSEDSKESQRGSAQGQLFYRCLDCVWNLNDESNLAVFNIKTK